MFSASPAELFQTYDLPRLHDMLATPDRHNQALAAKEIASFKFEQECGDANRRGRQRGLIGTVQGVPGWLR